VATSTATIATRFRRRPRRPEPIGDEPTLSGSVHVAMANLFVAASRSPASRIAHSRRGQNPRPVDGADPIDGSGRARRGRSCPRTCTQNDQALYPPVGRFWRSQERTGRWKAMLRHHDGGGRWRSWRTRGVQR
jgi:hypothetical protein